MVLENEAILHRTLPVAVWYRRQTLLNRIESPSRAHSPTHRRVTCDSCVARDFPRVPVCTPPQWIRSQAFHLTCRQLWRQAFLASAHRLANHHNSCTLHNRLTQLTQDCTSRSWALLVNVLSCPGLVLPRKEQTSPRRRAIHAPACEHPTKDRSIYRGYDRYVRSHDATQSTLRWGTSSCGMISRRPAPRCTTLYRNNKVSTRHQA